MIGSYITFPSLALIKYWGKRRCGVNVPATSSVALNIDSLHTTTTVRYRNTGNRDRIIYAGQEVPDEIYMRAYRPFFDYLRRALGSAHYYHAQIDNNFPIASGLASSSSIFAGLTLSCARLSHSTHRMSFLSNIARHGSASAARAIYGGFVVLPRGARCARQCAPSDMWPELRLVAAITTGEQKPLSSRVAMQHARDTSPVYGAWLRASRCYFRSAMRAIMRRDIEALGAMMRRSYLTMFSAMFTADPPIIYWNAQSVALLHICDQLRGEGIAAWETMDAGPHVKIITTATDLPRVCEAIHTSNIECEIICSTLGGTPHVFHSEDAPAQ